MNQKTVIEMTPDVANAIIHALGRLATIEAERIKRLNERCLDIEQAALYCGMKSKSTMYKLTSDGEIAYHKVGKYNVYRIADLDQYLALHRKASRYEIQNKLTP